MRRWVLLLVIGMALPALADTALFTELIFDPYLCLPLVPYLGIGGHSAEGLFGEVGTNLLAPFASWIIRGGIYGFGSPYLGFGLTNWLWVDPYTLNWRGAWGITIYGRALFSESPSSSVFLVISAILPMQPYIGPWLSFGFEVLLHPIPIVRTL